MSECSEIFPCSIPTQAMADLPLDGFANGSTQCEFYDADFATQLLANMPMTQYSRNTTEFQTAGQKAITVGDGIQQLGQAFQREQDIEFQGIPIATTILRNEVTIPKAHQIFRPIILGDPTNLTFRTQMQSSVLTTNRGDDKNNDICCELSQPVVSNPLEMEANLGNDNKEQSNPETEQELIRISEPQEKEEDCRKESGEYPFNNTIGTLTVVSGFRTAAGNSISAPTSAAIKEWTSKLVQASSIEEKDHIEKTDSSVDGPSFSTIPVTVDTITQGQPVSLQEQVTHPNVGGSNLADSQPSGFRTASGKNLKPPSKEALEKWSWKQNNFDTSDSNLFKNHSLETKLSCVPPADLESIPPLIPATPVPHASLVSSRSKQTSGFSTASGKNLQDPSIAALKEWRFKELRNDKATIANTPRASLFDVSSAFINSSYNASTPERFQIQKNRNVSLQTPTPNPLASSIKSTTPFGKRSGTLLKSVLTPHELRLGSTPFKAPNLSKFRSPLSNGHHQQATAKNRFFEDQNHEKRKSLSDLNLREQSRSNTPNNDEVERINCETAEKFVFIEAGTHYTTSKYRQSLIQEGCKSEYLSEKWINNHYSLILWKAAAMTKCFIDVECWNHNYVLQQLMYRYDCEVNLAKRSFFKLIVEGDGAVNGHVVLCVSRISIPDTGPPSLELTDGWYFVKAELDKPLEKLLKSGKIYPGQKLHTQGCKLTGISGPCPILESPPTLRLSLSFNSTRVAKRFEVLGSRKAFFPVCIRSIVEEGGTVNCLDCTITRIFPAVYFEKLADGKTIARSTQVEEEAFQEWQVRLLNTESV